MSTTDQVIKRRTSRRVVGRCSWAHASVRHHEAHFRSLHMPSEQTPRTILSSDGRIMSLTPSHNTIPSSSCLPLPHLLFCLPPVLSHRPSRLFSPVLPLSRMSESRFSGIMSMWRRWGESRKSQSAQPTKPGVEVLKDQWTVSRSADPSDDWVIERQIVDTSKDTDLTQEQQNAVALLKETLESKKSETAQKIKSTFRASEPSGTDEEQLKLLETTIRGCTVIDRARLGALGLAHDRDDWVFVCEPLTRI